MQEKPTVNRKLVSTKLEWWLTTTHRSISSHSSDRESRAVWLWTRDVSLGSAVGVQVASLCFGTQILPPPSWWPARSRQHFSGCGHEDRKLGGRAPAGSLQGLAFLLRPSCPHSNAQTASHLSVQSGGTSSLAHSFPPNLLCTGSKVLYNKSKLTHN